MNVINDEDESEVDICVHDDGMMIMKKGNT